MLSLAIRRLLILFATLFGILVLVFAFIHLAPGEPDPALLGKGETLGVTDSPRGFDRLLRWRIRRRLDLPLLFNPNPLERDAYADHYLDLALPTGRGGKRERGLARAALRLQGCAAIPVLVRRLDELGGGGDEAGERAFFGAQLARLGWPVEPGRRPGCLGGESWREEDLEPRLRALARDLVEGHESAGARARRYGSLLLPHLMELAAGAGDRARRARALNAIEALRPGGSAQRAPGSAQLERRWRAVRAWWREDGLRYRRLGALERTWDMVAHTQFASWVIAALRFDFGRDLRNRRIGEQLRGRLAVSLPLMACALVLVFCAAIPIGVWLATTRRSRPAGIVMTLLYGLYCAPQFWLALVLLALFAEPGPLALFSPSWSTHPTPPGAGFFAALLLALQRGVLPVLALSLPALAYLVRQTRASMVEVLGEEYIRAAAAKGLSRRRIIWKHAWRNSLMPLLTLMGGVLPALVGGSLVVESVFEIPGMGRFAYEALLRRDYNVVMAVTTLSAVLTLVGLQLSEMAYRWADPRIAHARR